VLDFDYKLIKTCKSINAAAREFNLDSGSVWAQVKLGSKRKSNTKIRFRKHPWI
jgi:molybdenum-dependent DNA-binding transcriptional regulator ModE